GDGDLDLFIDNSGWPMTGHLWLNDGSPFFTLGQDFSGGDVQGVAEMNGDGIPDVVWVDSNHIKVLWGVGDGTFIKGVSLASGIDPTSDHLAVADLDGDGDLDICATSGATIVHVNDGLGNFSYTNPFAEFTQGNLPNLATATDLDVDGLLDVVLFPADGSETS